MAEQLLKSVSVNSAIGTRTPIVLHAEETVNQVLEELSKNHITSAPIYELDTRTPIGFVDTLDLVWFALDIANSDLPSHQGMIESRTKQFGAYKVGKVAGKSQRSLWYPIASTGTLFDAAQHFKLGVHRVPIIDYTGGYDNLTGIITQSDGAQFLFENKDKLASFFNQKISDVNPKLLHKVVSVNKNEITLAAFQKFSTKGVNAVPVVDDDGKLVGNLSPNDLKGLFGRAFENLLDPVGEFIRTIRLRKGEKNIDFIASLTPEHTLGEALDIIVQQRVHRLYICDDSKKPIGVLALTDLFALLLPEQE